MTSVEVDAENQSTPIAHMAQLDGLRAVAILCVFVWHFVDDSNALHDFVQWGWVGVRLFFVISGFLITGILLRCRRRFQSENHSGWWTLRNFYVRRFLRIFPIYYALIFVLFLGLPRMREDIGWYLTYLQNVMFALDNQYSVGPHLWTLAVEEQFYVVWPILILFLPQRWLLPSILLSIALGPASRLAALSLQWTSFSAMMLTPSNMDTLAMGALLAFLASNKSDDWTRTFSRRCLSVGLPILVVYVVCHNLGFARVSKTGQSAAEWALFVSADFGAALTYTWVVYRAAQGFGGRLGRLLSSRALAYVGKISYGLYVFHHPVQEALNEIVFPRLGWQLPNSSLATFFLYSIVSFVIAAASWHVFEKPINALKRHFPYNRPVPGDQGYSAAT
jgi:peptidoglycan/LPS O-acetylase OafA/YrhL